MFEFGFNRPVSADLEDIFSVVVGLDSESRPTEESDDLSGCTMRVAFNLGSDADVF